MTIARLAPFRRIAFVRCLFFFMCLVSLPASADLHGAAAAKTSFDLPADVLEKSVKRFAAQSGLEVLIPSDALAGVRTRGVRGEMTSRQALDAMLAGTGLTVLQDPKTGAFSVRKEAPKEGVEQQRGAAVVRSPHAQKKTRLRSGQTKNL